MVKVISCTQDLRDWLHEQGYGTKDVPEVRPVVQRKSKWEEVEYEHEMTDLVWAYPSVPKDDVRWQIGNACNIWAEHNGDYVRFTLVRRLKYTRFGKIKPVLLPRAEAERVMALPQDKFLDRIGAEFNLQFELR